MDTLISIDLSKFLAVGSNQFVAEASDLGLDRIPDKLAIVGAKLTQVFVHRNTERSTDNEVISWNFRPLDEALNLVLTIFND